MNGSRAYRFLRKKAHPFVAYIRALRSALRVQFIRKRLRKASPAPRLVLISMFEHMGDIVAAEPIVRYLRKDLEHDYLIWCIRTPYKELAIANPFVDDVLEVHCAAEWGFLKKWGVFDKSFDLHIIPRQCSGCRVSVESDASRLGIDSTNYFHLGSLLEVFCTIAGIPAIDESPRVYISGSVKESIDRRSLPDRFLAVHCKSEEPAKDWPQESWLELCHRVGDELGIWVIEVGLSPVIKQPGLPGYLSFCGELSILQTAELIRRAKVFVGIDSGPAHLAHSVQTPGIILLGKYLSFDQYMPYSGRFSRREGCRILRSDESVAAIPVDRVFNAIRESLGSEKA